MSVIADDLKGRVLERIDEREVLDFARLLGETPSQCGVDPEDGVADLVIAKLKEAGLETELREVQPRRPNALGFWRGTGGGPSLMFNGHLDTMYFSTDWPYGHESAIEDGVLRVHGIRNMKGGVAAMVMAAVAIARAGVRLRGDLIVAGVMGHHEGSVGTWRLIEEGLVPDYAIVPEPTDLGVRTIQTGSVNFKLHVRGRTGATGSPDLYRRYGDLESVPVDAIQKAYKVIQALQTVDWTFEPYPPMPDLPMFQVRGILGGYGPRYMPGAFVPDLCTVTIVVMTVPGMTVESVQADLERMIARLRHWDPELDARVELMAARPDRAMRPALQVDENALVAQAVRRQHVAIAGREPAFGAVLPNSYFGCDAQPLWVAGCQAISYGPAGHAYIAQNRGRVRIEHLMTCTRVLALSALEIGMADRASLGLGA